MIKVMLLYIFTEYLTKFLISYSKHFCVLSKETQSLHTGEGVNYASEVKSVTGSDEHTSD